GGRPEEAFGRDAGQLGQHLVGEGRVRDRLPVVVEPDRALATGEGLLDGADLAAVLIVLLELDRDDRSGRGRRIPWAKRFDLGGPARVPGGGGRRASARDRE